MSNFIYWVAILINLGASVITGVEGHSLACASHLVVAGGLLAMILVSRRMNIIIVIQKDLHEKITKASKVKRKF